MKKAAVMDHNARLPVPVSTTTAEHYAWGSGCNGWHLLRNSEMSIIQESMPPQTAEVPHYHQHTLQFFLVLEGVLTVSTPGQTHVLSREQGLEISPKIPHLVSNKSQESTSFLVVSYPPSHGDRVVVGEVE